MRAPYQVLAIPYKYIGDRLYFCIFHRSDNDIWQFVAGGGEEGENLLDSAKREVLEETGIKTDNLFMLKSIAYLPVTVVEEKHRMHWDKNTYVIPECSFAFECNSDIILTDEHDELMWATYDEAVERLRYDSNITALYELLCILFHEKSLLYLISDSVKYIKVKDYSITITKLVDNINSVLSQMHNRKIKIKAISDWLIEKGFFETYTTRFGKSRKRLTNNGSQIGIVERFHLIKGKNWGYNMFLFKKEAQQFIIDNLGQILCEHPEGIDVLNQSSKIPEAKIPEMEELNG